MQLSKLSVVLLLVSGMCFHILQSNAGDSSEERQMEVSLRMIGHQVLLNHGDSTSRVLPITKEDDRYRISFETDFEFSPGRLVQTIDSVVLATRMASGYLVEVENCATGEVVYSYEINSSNRSDVVPCAPRAQPLACYSLLFTILDPTWPVQVSDTGSVGFASTVPQAILVILLIGLFVYLYRKMGRSGSDPNQIRIGKYVFDKRKMTLSIDDQSVELSGKEADLLLLLQTSANTTLEREAILKSVWGDEGDYVGRTLDVFISKLRKKLEGDASIKITNIRGVGYKLVVDDAG